MSNGPSPKPKEWTSPKIKDCLTSISAGASPVCDDSPAQPGEIGVLKTSAIGNGVFDPSENKKLLAASTQSVKTPVRANTLLICRKNTPELVGGVAYVERAHPNLFLPDLLWELTAKPDIDARYFGYVLQSAPIQAAISSSASGSSRSMANISMGAFGEILVALAPLPEQRRISEILSSWDEATEKLEALRAAKKRRRKGILQCLFGNGVDFPSDWKTKPLSAVTTRVSRTNDGGDHPVMTISAKSGFLMQSDKFARDMAGSSVDKYTLIHQGEFAYNKGNSKTAPYGCIFALDRPTAVVPFVYFCFQLNDGHDHGFFEHIFKAGILNHQLSKVINSGVRNDGLLNLYADDFFSCVVPVPPRDEQERISRAITALNDDIALTDNEIAALQRQKRGLMQKLLTGEWRVAANSEAEVVE